MKSSRIKKRWDECPKGLKGLMIILAILIFTIGVPIVINECYKVNSGYITFWGAADVLIYYGTISGATATIIAVVCTIRFSKKQQMEDRILAARPWFSSNTHLLNKNSEIAQLQDGNAIYVFADKGAWVSSTVAPTDIQEGRHQINQDDCVIQYTLENVGGDSATSIGMYLGELPHPLIPSFALSKNAQMVFVLILPHVSAEVETKYSLVFEFGDTVSKTIYRQKETLVVKRDTYGVTFAQGINDLLSAPAIKEA